MSKVKKLVNISENENKRLKDFCKKNGFSESFVVETLIKNYLEDIKVVCEKGKE